MVTPHVLQDPLCSTLGLSPAAAGAEIAGRSLAGGDRKASELSQAEGHQGAALEFLQHIWTMPDMAFPDPAGLCLLGINMASPPTPPLHNRVGRGGPVTGRTPWGVATLLGRESIPALSFLTWKMGLDKTIAQAAQCWNPEESEQPQGLPRGQFPTPLPWKGDKLLPNSGRRLHICKMGLSWKILEAGALSVVLL